LFRFFGWHGLPLLVLKIEQIIKISQHFLFRGLNWLNLSLELVVGVINGKDVFENFVGGGGKV